MTGGEKEGVELAIPEPSEIVLPGTGELISLDQPEQCARALEAIRRLEGQLREAKATLKRAIVEESERQGSPRLRFGDVAAVVKHNRDIKWDMEELEKLLDAGLPPDRWTALVTETIDYKVNARVADQIARANERYAKIVMRARHDEERDPTVEVLL